jgi:hypothetical protein
MEEQDFLNSIGGSYIQPEVVQPKQNGLLKRIGKGALDLGVGFAKGAAETLGSVAVNTEKVIKDIATTKSNKEYASLLDDINTQNQKLISLANQYPKEDPKHTRYMDLIKQNQEQANILRDEFFGTGGIQENIQKAGLTKGIKKITTPTNATQKFGRGAEKVGEFLVSAKGATGLIPKGTTPLTKIASNTASGFVGGAVPSTMQSATLGQFDTMSGTKESLKEAGVSGTVGGAVSGALSATGEALRASKLPSRLMSNIYKSDKKTVEKIFSGEKVDGEKLSDWAVKNKLSGSVEQQAEKLNTILKNSENSVIKSAEASKIKVPVHQNLFKLAQNIMKDYETVGRGEIATSADDFLRAVKDNSVTVKDAIKFRRVLDSLRTENSFVNPKLGNELGYWSDDLREIINNSDGIGAINKEYSNAIKARKALINYATSTGNQKALGALEAYFLGGGAITGQTAPTVGTIIAKRTVQNPRVLSGTAQAIENAKPSTKVRTLISKGVGDTYRKNKENKIIRSLQ